MNNYNKSLRKRLHNNSICNTDQNNIIFRFNENLKNKNPEFSSVSKKIILSKNLLDSKQ
jgi:hypothetical protein